MNKKYFYCYKCDKNQEVAPEINSVDYFNFDTISLTIKFSCPKCNYVFELWEGELLFRVV